MVDEPQAFRLLQAGLKRQFDKIWFDREAERTVVVLPSLSLDREVMDRITGAHHYEERLLSMLLLLRLPRTKVIYLSSVPIPDVIIDYYLHLLPGIPVSHARKRLVLLSCHDASQKSLTEKILDRPRILARIRQEISSSEAAHMTCYNATHLER